MTSWPLVSVIIPVYNGEAFVGNAIESVLRQRHRPLEIIVVDDGSTDGSAAVVRRFRERVRYHRQANAGAASSRNRGVSMARGPLISFLDADDLYVENKLTLQVQRLELNPRAEIVIGYRQYLMLEDSATDSVFREHLEPAMSLQLGCGLFRATVFPKVGRFTESLRICDDWDWFLRARELGVRLLIHRDVVLHQRIHGGNITRQREKGQQEMLRILKRSIDRRRRGGREGSLQQLSNSVERPDEG